jgi:hypothetical protein
LEQKFLTPFEDSVPDHRAALDSIDSIDDRKAEPVIVGDPSLKSFLSQLRIPTISRPEDLH